MVEKNQPKSLWEISATDIDGKLINLGDVAGKRCTLITNVASK
jgi:glutathione peroxidase-family protein